MRRIRMGSGATEKPVTINRLTQKAIELYFGMGRSARVKYDPEIVAAVYMTIMSSTPPEWASEEMLKTLEKYITKWNVKKWWKDEQKSNRRTAKTAKRKGNKRV